MENAIVKSQNKNFNYSREEILNMLALKDQDEIDQLFCQANSVRKDFFGEEVHLRGIIEFSNVCRRNCLYCGLRRENRILHRYRMTKEEIIYISDVLVECGIKTIVLQSGEDSYYTVDLIEELISEIKNRHDIAITLCLGERPHEQYARWYNAGADRYLLKHETIDPNLYHILHPDMKYSNRIGCLEDLQSIGYQIGAGNIIGLPGQNLNTIADDILFLKKIDADMAGIGPFIAHSITPLYKSPPGDVNLTLKTLAVARIVLKDTHLPVTTALRILDENGYEKGLSCGANVIMPNFTPDPYRKFYEIYPGKDTKIFSPKRYINDIQKQVTQMGRIVSTGKGHSLKFNRINFQGCHNYVKKNSYFYENNTPC